MDNVIFNLYYAIVNNRSHYMEVLYEMLELGKG